MRLGRVRRDLAVAAARDETVRAVANRWGFWHMGHFGQDYKRQFGELPVETRGRARRD